MSSFATYHPLCTPANVWKLDLTYEETGDLGGQPELKTSSWKATQFGILKIDGMMLLPSSAHEFISLLSLVKLLVKTQ